jgi:hypothetical protein
VSVHFQTTPTRLEQSMTTFALLRDCPQWRCCNLTLEARSVTSFVFVHHFPFATEELIHA